MFVLGGTTGVGVVALWGVANLSCLVNVAAGRFRLDEGVALLGGLSVFTLLQSLMLPFSWVAVFDADIAQTWAQTLELLDAPVRASLSLQPVTTRLEAMKLWAYAVTWGVVADFAVRRGIDVVAQRVVWLVVLVVGVTLLHKVLGLQRVYAVYQPQQVQPYWVGPLLNMNNLGGLCNLGTFAALSLTFRNATYNRSWFVSVGFALASITMTLATGSRGAVGTLSVGLLVFAVLLWRNRALISIRRWGGVLVVAVGLILSVLVFDQDRLLGNLADTSIEKSKTVRLALQVLKVHGFWGLGKGAFEVEFPVVQPSVGRMLYPYVECFPIDWALAWGLPIAMMLLVSTFTALFKPRGGVRTNTLRLALGVLLAQNVFDLGLEVPGVVVPWLCVFAAFWSTSARSKAWGTSRGRVTAILAAGMALTSSLGIPNQSAAETRFDALDTFKRAPDGNSDELRRALLNNPGDHTLLRARALQVAIRQEAKALAWVNVALLRAPHSALTYMTLGQVLWMAGAQSQAVGAFRKAAEDPALHGELQAWLVAREPRALLAVAPNGRNGAALLISVALAQRDFALQAQLLEAALTRAPNDPEIGVSVIEWKVGAAVSGSDDTCARDPACVATLQTRVNELERQATASDAGGDTSLRLRLVQARVRSLSGDTRGAFEVLRPLCQVAATDVRCATTALELGKRLGGEAYDDAAARYLDAFCLKSDRCVEERVVVGGDLTAAGRFTAALRQYVLAAAEGTDPGAFVGASVVAARLGREREALHWLTKGEQRFGHGPAFEAQRQRLGLPGRLNEPPTPAEWRLEQRPERVGDRPKEASPKIRAEHERSE